MYKILELRGGSFSDIKRWVDSVIESHPEKTYDDFFFDYNYYPVSSDDPISTIEIWIKEESNDK